MQGAGFAHAFLFCDGFYCTPLNRDVPFGTGISNRAPLPGVPFSVIVMPVMDRISRVFQNQTEIDR